MRISRSVAIAVAALVVLPVFGGLAFAHHSLAGYEPTKQVELRGTVVEYNWRNPHVFVIWAVKDASGKVTNWSGEMNSPTSMIQVGMSRTSLKKGDEIIVTCKPSRTGLPLSVIQTIKLADGKMVVDRINNQ